jgi:aldose 1-epimerase
VPYCCPEPQSWTTNAPNAPDPEAEGFRAIAPGDKWSMRFRLYADRR